MATRRATHSGSWYKSNKSALDSELSRYLAEANPTSEQEFTFPVNGCKAIIAPHAGYSYSGPTAAWAYKSIDVTGIKRVFILGPLHKVYLTTCALSVCKEYATPLGNLPLDLETISELKATGQFQTMDVRDDEDEHSLEMHLPYVRKVFEGIDISIVPIMVGQLDKSTESAFGRILAPFLSRDDTLCVVSSDFCHWGTRFSYTYYYPQQPTDKSDGIRLGSDRAIASLAIHESIAALDKQATDILTVPPTTATESHDKFAQYLSKTHNTICGRHPIGVLFGALSAFEETGKTPRVEWVKYAQSSQCFTTADSSVSYASAYVTF